MRNVDFLIVGQGVSGSFMSWRLEKAGRSCMVIDNPDPFSSSRIAAGIINPVTGRRVAQTWMIDTLLPFALKFYEDFGKELNIATIAERNMISFFPAPQMLQSFFKRIEEDPTYLSLPAEPNRYLDQFSYDFGFGEISPCYAVNLQELLPAWRKKLIANDQLREDHFDHSKIKLNDNNISYEDITAGKIIFCDGIRAAANPWFKNLPFAYNKGEALLIRSDTIPKDQIFKKGISLTWLKEDIYWVGSSYEWSFIDDKPSAIFRERTISLLKGWLKHPFELVDHVASVRPATIERRPFVGVHPRYPQIGILNGMGAKGCSLAPYFAQQLTDHFTAGNPLQPDADIKRFARILSI